MSAIWVMRLLACAVALGGVAARLDGFGRYGLWNDEAWVALATRVEGCGSSCWRLASRRSDGARW